MTRRCNTLAVAALIAVTGLGLGAGTARSVVTPARARPLGGVNATGLTFGASTTSVKRVIAWAHSLDAHALRVEIPWSTIEPTQGQFDPRALAFADNLVNQASAAGIKVVALAMSTPCWASSAPAALLSRCRPGEGGRAQAWPPRNPRDYGSFVAFLAAR